MFEDSTFESTGRIRTRSRGWMIAAFAFNSTILLAMVVVPLIYPEALPRITCVFLIPAPPPQSPPPHPPQQPVHVAHVSSEMMGNQLVAPRRIPAGIDILAVPEPPGPNNVAIWDEHLGLPGSMFRGRAAQPAVREAPPTHARISSGVMNGLLIRKTLPVYPSIARAAGVEGTVILQATISRTGIIENLRVIAGPAMLQQAALNAVSTWVYRPYLLNGQPVEVETTINVVFSLH